ncbi:hypothetical protein QWI17_17080 [Gilvimarinus sp. SDUM040013]|uniref:Solute-binding protein family 3/N-terminal domain-containing protein n=1 Tax=Gilvimarinus gilvus TaxID=3058038 RepID=A0ABU4S0Z3_9GAMM|nr:hypothetical protein [Gilvimarinus sp. SDUM040013]MDO3387559.1 hypothetical protein [Gilvimarinus sp. SDUM040013]MDX6850176.1 hypothetical protein [Gilvimarinus sp. SDUM040013]
MTIGTDYLTIHKLLLIVAGAVSLTSLAAQPPNASTPDRVVLTPGSSSVERTRYESAVVELALNKSKARFGDYTLVYHDIAYSRTRTTRLLTEGNEVNVITAPHLALDPKLPPNALTTIRIPLLKGMLGKRQLIVRRDRLAEFEQIENLTQLRQFTAGLGFDWSDNLFFERNQLPFFTGTSIAQLFNMLRHQRFDYFPLGLVEASSALANSGMAQELAIVENVMIEYPLPVYIQVSANKPQLAQRLEFGLQQAQADGSLQALFNYHYGDLAERTKHALVLPLQDLAPGSYRHH